MAVPISACELCGGSEWRPHLAAVLDYITGERFDLERCATCGLVVTCPMPSAAELDRYYPGRYRTDRQKQTGQWRVRRRAAMLQRHFPRGFRGRVLDLGCGTGAFALEMQRRGWTVAVTELNQAVLSDMRERGMEARTPDKALQAGFSAPFDAITCWHVLEHVNHPLQLAKWSRRMLAPDGVMQIAVPNLDSWQAVRFGRSWMHLDVPRHCYHFTPATLRRLLHDAGLEIVATRTLALEYDMFGVMQSALNRVCSKPNVLFERLTARDATQPASSRDVALSYTLSPILGAVALPHCLAAAAVGRGATLLATCRAMK